MTRDIKHTWFFNHPPQDIWEFLTDPELLAQWLMESNFRPIVGHKFNFNTRPKIKLGFDGNIYCEVLAVEPKRLLSYSWRGGPGKGKITLDSVVTWTLTPKNNGTELQLIHSGFKGFGNYITYLVMNKGWIKIIKRFSQKLQNERATL
jgi:uncharacterized protein YndB with AHSA1/START domain